MNIKLAICLILIILLSLSTGFLGGMLYERRDITITVEQPIY